ncbi:MAG: hypothetical protein M3414_01895 [Pseudomonadota bacterium]|nr:hypothetical protein [Pseudomonadota bacterium]
MRHNRISRLTPLAFAVLGAAGLLLGTMAAQDSAMAAGGQVEIHGTAISTPQSRMEGDMAMDSAVAAAVIGAVSRQFGERRIEVKLDSVSVQPASLRDRSVSGEGRILIGDSDAAADNNWIPIQFAALYDTQSASVSHPALVIGNGSASADQLALDAPLALEFGARIDAALAEEFQQQPAQMIVDRITTTPAGVRYLRVSALGTADFADEGTTAAQIDALYDRKTGEWVRLTYELGTTSNWSADDAEEVAAR